MSTSTEYSKQTISQFLSTILEGADRVRGRGGEGPGGDVRGGMREKRGREEREVEKNWENMEGEKI